MRMIERMEFCSSPHCPGHAILREEKSRQAPNQHVHQRTAVLLDQTGRILATVPVPTEVVGRITVDVLAGGFHANFDLPEEAVDLDPESYASLLARYGKGSQPPEPGVGAGGILRSPDPQRTGPPVGQDTWHVTTGQIEPPEPPWPAA